MKRDILTGCTALVTGASAGIGREFARQIAARARVLLLVARRADRLDELQRELVARRSELVVHVFAADLADSRAVDRLRDEIGARALAIDLLINNAGLGDIGPFHTSEPQRVADMLAVNVTALTTLARVFLPGMVARRRGTIINVSSSAAYLPVAGFAVYAATKAYVNSFSEGIRAELRGTGVTVTALCPGPVRTEFTEVAQRADVPARLGLDFVYVSVEQVVRDALAAAAADRPVVIPGSFMKIGMMMIRLLPMPLVRQISRLYAKGV